MTLRTLFAGLLASSFILSTPALADDGTTRELRREITKLHGDISLSAGSLLLLSQQTALRPKLQKADDITVLAALQVMNRKKFSENSDEINIEPTDVSEARNKIEIYKMLCMSAGEHKTIFDKYCAPPPYEGLHKSYLDFLSR